MKNKALLVTGLVLMLNQALHCQQFRWVTPADSPQDLFLRHSVTDSLGNTFVVGMFSDSLVLGNNDTVLYSKGGTDVYLAAYSYQGHLWYARQIGGPGNEEVNKVHNDGQGHVIFCGAFTDSVDMDAGTGSHMLKATLGKDGYVCRYHVLGNFEQAIHFKGNDAEVRDVSWFYDRFLIVGNFWNSVDLNPGSGSDTHTSKGLRDAFVCAVDTNGSEMWGYTLGSSGMDGANSLDVAMGNVYVAGTFAGMMDFDAGPGNQQWGMPGGGQYDIWLLRVWYSDGAYSAHGRYGGDANEDVLDLMAYDGNEVWLTGIYSGTCDFDPRQETPKMMTAKGGEDMFIQKINMFMLCQWVGSVSGPANENGRAISVSKQHVVTVTGYFEYTADLDPGDYERLETSNGGSADMYFLQLNQWGNYLCHETVGGPGSDGGAGVGTDLLNNIYVAGFYGRNHTGTTDFDPGSGTAMLHSEGAYEGFVASYSGCDITVGLRQEKEIRAELVPNPSYGKVDIVGLPEGARLEIFNTAGRLVRVETLHEQQSIDVSDLPEGLYFLRCETNTAVQTTKLLKLNR